MNKDEIIDEFFRGFKVALTNSFSYSKDHPYFLKSVESFKEKLDLVLSVLSPFRVGVTDQGVMVEEKNLNKAGFYDELARLLHQRKIKSLEIRQGISAQELVSFFSIISMSQKDIFKNGGVKLLLKNEGAHNLIVEELDYSAFLQDGGQECADIWGYMLRDAAHGRDAGKLEKMADDFGRVIRRYNESDIMGSEEVCENINEFLVALKESNSDKFEQCSKDVFLWLLKNKKAIDQEKLEKLKPVFGSLNNENFSSLLWEGLTQDANFDSLSLELFSKIADKKGHEQIAEGMLNKLDQSELSDNPNVVKKIQNLLGTKQPDQVSAVYHNVLESIIKSVISTGNLTFDQKQVRENYRYIILSMLLIESDPENIKAAVEALEKELQGLFDENAAEFLKDLQKLLAKRKEEGIAACAELEKKLSIIAEDMILERQLQDDQGYILDMVCAASHEFNFYADKIFSGDKVNKQLLALFFKLFPENLPAFYEKLAVRLQDMEYVCQLVDILGQIEAFQITEVLEYIYSCANELVKLDVLKVMRQAKKVDGAFLKRQLNTDSYQLRKAILSVLVLDEKQQETVLGFLFNVAGKFGKRNKELIKNMQIAFELNLEPAKNNIRQLSQKRFFWNRELKDKAKQILKEWNVL